MLSKEEIARALTMLLSDDDEQLILAHAIFCNELGNIQLYLSSNYSICVNNFTVIELHWSYKSIIKAIRQIIKEKFNLEFVYSLYTNSFKWYGSL